MRDEIRNHQAQNVMNEDLNEVPNMQGPSEKLLQQPPP